MKATIERVSIHIHSTNQDATARMELKPVEYASTYVAVLSDIPNLNPFKGTTRVALKLPYSEIIDDFYWGGIGIFKITDKEKESEGREMKHKVTITKTERRVLEEYWCMRAIKINFINNAKSVVKEQECEKYPTLEEIADFLGKSNADFVSVENNYRFEPELPFD